jgi:uncharacterized protein YprB with RNaseH-like and TPR domain
MLKKTFCHIDGITKSTEKLLWDHGIESWDSLHANEQKLSILSETKKTQIKEELVRSQKALEEGNLSYFKELLDPKEHWRCVGYGKMAFVDIETTGLSKWNHEITLLGIYDGVSPEIYINGINLEKAKEKLEEFDIIVTFNGKQFDLPFIESYFKTSYHCIHLDLRYLLKELGYQGGLKLIEKQLGITRGEETEGVDGFEAIRLWNRYKKGCAKSLETLISYNTEDIVNLKTLLNHYLHSKNPGISSYV